LKNRKLLPRDELVEVQQHARQHRPRRVLLHLDARRLRRRQLLRVVGRLREARALLFEQPPQTGGLALVRAACERETEGVADGLRVASRSLGQYATGERLSAFEEALVVEQRQRLERRVGAIAARTRGGRFGRVEDRQARVRRGTPEEGVHAAPVTV